MNDTVKAMLEALMAEQHNYGTAIEAITESVKDKFWASAAIDKVKKGADSGYYRAVEAIARNTDDGFYIVQMLDKI